MADVVVASGEVASGTFTLEPGVVSTVTFEDNIGAVQIWTDQTEAVYYTVDGREPEVDDRIAFMIPRGTIATAETANTPGAGDVVKLVSAGSPSVRVEIA